MKEIIVVLHNIRSVYNVASIFRTADGAGVKKIYLCGITPTPLDRLRNPRRDFIKVSLGAEKSVLWEKFSQTALLIDKLKKEGYRIFAVEQSPKSVPYYKVNIKRQVSKFVLILGNEVRGLSPAILKRADKILEIPMRGAMLKQAHHPKSLGCGKESLNVAVAFGIVIYGLIYK